MTPDFLTLHFLSAIRDAEREGFTHFARALRQELARLLANKSPAGVPALVPPAGASHMPEGQGRAA